MIHQKRLDACPPSLIKVRDRRVKGGYYCRARSKPSSLAAASGALAGVGILGAAAGGSLLAASASNQLKASQDRRAATAQKLEADKKLAQIKQLETEQQKLKEQRENKPGRKYEIAGNLLAGAVEGAIPGATIGGPVGAGLGAAAGLTRAGGSELAGYLKERNPRVGSALSKSIEVGAKQAESKIQKKIARKDAYFSGLEYAKRYDAKKCGRGWIADDLECNAGLATKALGKVARKIESGSLKRQTSTRQKIFEDQGIPTPISRILAQTEERLKLAGVEKGLGPLSTELSSLDLKQKKVEEKVKSVVDKHLKKLNV